MIWERSKSVHHSVQLWPCVWLMIHGRTHLKLVYLNYLLYSSAALENEGEGDTGLCEFTDFLCVNLMQCTNISLITKDEKSR